MRSSHHPPLSVSSLRANRRRQALSATILAATCVLLLSGCGDDPDKTAPPAPTVSLENIESPTHEQTWIFRGSAEPGSTIMVARAPEFTAEEQTQWGPFETATDRFTSEWWIEVPLAPNVDNVFSFTASDKRGNVSEAAERTIRHIAPAAALVLTLEAADVNGDAEGLQVMPDTTIGLTWQVTDAFGNAVDAPVDVTTSAPGFIMGSELSDVTAVGTYNVIATVSGTNIGASASFDVVPGDPARITLTLSDDVIRAGHSVVALTSLSDAWGNAISNNEVTLATDAPATGATIDQTLDEITFTAAGDFTVTASALSMPDVSASGTVIVRPGPVTLVDLVLDPAPAIVMPGDVVGVTVTATDQFGNAGDEVIRVSTNAPGAFIAGGELTNLTVAGSYTVWAEAEGGGALDSESLTVTPGNAAVIDLTLLDRSQTAGVPLKYFVTITDAQGNIIEGAFTISSSDTNAVFDEALGTVTFSASGVHTVTVDYDGLTDTEAVQVYTQPDVVSPGVTIVSPTTGAAFSPGALLLVDVDVSDDIELSEVRLQARGAFRFDDTILIPSGQTTYAAQFYMSIPQQARYGDAILTAAAYDKAGHLTVGDPITIRVDPSWGIFTETGVSIQAIAGGPGSNINGPMGICFDPADPNFIYLANRNNDNVLSLDTTTGTSQQWGGTFFWGQPQDIAVAPDGTLYVSANGDVSRIDTNGILDEAWVTPGNAFGLVFNDQNNNLYVADDNGPSIYTYNATTGNGAAFSQTNNPNNIWGLTLPATTSQNGDNVLFATNDNSNEIWAFNISQGQWSRVNLNGPNPNNPKDIIRLPNGALLVASRNTGSLLLLNNCNPDIAVAVPNTCTSTRIVANLARPVGLALDPRSTATTAIVLVSDDTLDAIFEVTIDLTQY